MAWDSTMYKEKKTDKEMAHIVYSRFKAGDTKDGIKYSLGGLYVRPIVKYVSNAAYEALIDYEKTNKVKSSVIIDGVGLWYDKLTVKKMGITREHMLPVNALYEYFNKLYKEKILNEAYIVSLIKKLHIAIITDKENKILSSKNHLSRKMPNGWWDKDEADILDRYRISGLSDDIWVKKFIARESPLKVTLLHQNGPYSLK